MPRNQTLKKVGIASVIMMASVFLSRIMGVFREMAIAGMGGIDPAVDAYQVAFIIPEILNHVAATGFLSITFIPIFTGYLTRGEEEEGFRVFSIILNTAGAGLVVLIIAGMILAPQLVALFSPGLQGTPAFDLAVKMTRIVIPAQFFFFAGGLWMAVLFARENFFIPALAPLIYNLSIIGFGLALGPVLGMEGFAWGVLFGAFAGNFALQVLWAKRQGSRYGVIFDFSHPEFRRYIGLTLPLMLGLTMTFSMEILLKFFGSLLAPGSIAALTYALRIMFVLVGLFGQAVGTASYPYMAALARKADLTELNRLLNQTLKFILVVIPVSVLFSVLSPEIVQILFERGKFDAHATQITATILPFFMAGAFAFAAQNLVSRGFYALKNTLFPVLLTSACVIASLPVIAFFMTIMGAKGVAAGLSLTITLQCLILFEAWNKRSANTEKKGVYTLFLKLIPLSLILGLALQASVLFLRNALAVNGHPQGPAQSLILCIAAGLEFLILMPVLGKIMKIEEIARISDRILETLKKILHLPG